jgi:purine-nucleoside phosphorylase
MSSAHINAGPGAFADTVLLPGDPCRARHIATTLLDDAIEVSNVRNMLGFTGAWHGQRLSIMGTGMGIPSTLIYVTELTRNYGVKRFVRLGTCGAIAPELELGSIVVALGAGTDSRVNRIRFRDYDFPATASWPLLERVARMARNRGQKVHVGNVFSSDQFYHPDVELRKSLARLGFLGIEMETAGLYGVAPELGVEALAVLTISDQLDRSSSMSPAQRETGLDDMTRLVLDALAADSSASGSNP